VIKKIIRKYNKNRRFLKAIDKLVDFDFALGNMNSDSDSYSAQGIAQYGKVNSTDSFKKLIERLKSKNPDFQSELENIAQNLTAVSDNLDSLQNVYEGDAWSQRLTNIRENIIRSKVTFTRPRAVQVISKKLHFERKWTQPKFAYQLTGVTAIVLVFFAGVFNTQNGISKVKTLAYNDSLTLEKSKVKLDRLESNGIAGFIETWFSAKYKRIYTIDNEKKTKKTIILTSKSNIDEVVASLTSTSDGINIKDALSQILPLKSYNSNASYQNITLGTASKIKISSRKTNITVQLEEGSVYYSGHLGTSVSFIIKNKKFELLGTRVLFKQNKGKIEVMVHEGKVRVSPLETKGLSSAKENSSFTLSQGMKMYVSPAGNDIIPISKEELEKLESLQLESIRIVNKSLISTFKSSNLEKINLTNGAGVRKVAKEKIKSIQNEINRIVTKNNSLLSSAVVLATAKKTSLKKIGKLSVAQKLYYDIHNLSKGPSKTLVSLELRNGTKLSGTLLKINSREITLKIEFGKYKSYLKDVVRYQLK